MLLINKTSKQTKITIYSHLRSWNIDVFQLREFFVSNEKYNMRNVNVYDMKNFLNCLSEIAKIFHIYSL